MMRDNENGYSAWRELKRIADDLTNAIADKDELAAAYAIYEAMWTMVNEHEGKVLTTQDGDLFFEREDAADVLADLFDQMFGQRVAVTGWYDPEEDARDGINDEYTGKYYVNID